MSYPRSPRDSLRAVAVSPERAAPPAVPAEPEPALEPRGRSSPELAADRERSFVLASAELHRALTWKAVVPGERLRMGLARHVAESQEEAPLAWD